MQIVSYKKEDMTEYGKASLNNVYSVHVKIDDLYRHAREMISVLANDSWVKRLGVVERASFEARARRTVEKLINDIFSKVDNTVTTEFGEYMISMSAQGALEQQFNHKPVPLAELIKEKVSGNPGFDFHTESENMLIIFGEAKYSGTSNPYTKAVGQIIEFIGLEKDISELVDLKYFVSADAVNNALINKKGFVAAFSINSRHPSEILKHALTSELIEKLLGYEELYIIGVEVC